MRAEVEQEVDPRTAIRRAYATLELGFGDPTLARRENETAGIFVRRVFGNSNDVRELTKLFELARFSEHEITPEMRTKALDLVERVRLQYTHEDKSSTVGDPLTAAQS